MRFDLGIERRIILGGCSLDSSGSGLVTGSYEHGNEPSGSIKVKGFLD
jgi:hypothetical protein